MTKPNILYIHSHDTGRYIQPYTGDVPAPNIQKLAEQGIIFRDCHNGAPTCSPSRGVLLTGQAAHSCGQFGLAHRGFELQERDRHLAKFLADNGYNTVQCGIHHVVKDPLTVGYKKRIATSPPEGRHWDCYRAEEAAAFLEQSTEEPFFLAVGFIDTHRDFPGAKGRDLDPRWCRPPVTVPDTPETRADMSEFIGSAAALDENMGLVFDALEKSGKAENTLVICTTDHGIAFPYMKCNCTSHGTGVMLIIKGPGGFEGGRVSNALVSHADIFPTVCELLELDPPGWLQGVSLLPIARNETDTVREEAYAEINFHCTYEPIRSVRTKKYLYVKRFHDRPTPMLSQIDNSPSKTIMMENGLGEAILPKEQLFDLMLDPNEVHNVAEDPAYTDVLKDMQSRLDTWMKDTDDPLLKGPILPHEGAIVNEPDDISPKDWQKRQ